MKYLLFILLFIPFLLFSQQVNYTYGQKTDGTWYTETGYQDADSVTTIDIIFDMQDYYFQDFNPLKLTYAFDESADGDSVGATTVYSNSDRMYFGTFWFRVDAAAGTDSNNIYIEAYPGGRYYEAGDGDRIETSDMNFSTTAVTLRDTISANRVKGDIQWAYVNVYLATAAKFLPPEFIKIKLGWSIGSFDGGSTGDAYWHFVYFAVYESEQEGRTTRQGDADNRKPDETLH